MPITDEQRDALIERAIELAGQNKVVQSGSRVIQTHDPAALVDAVDKLSDLAAKQAFTGSPFGAINRRVFRMGGTG